jgi:hypothetical protein
VNRIRLRADFSNVTRKAIKGLNWLLEGAEFMPK